MIIAQQFTAGARSERSNSPQSGRLNGSRKILFRFSRPFHGLPLCFTISPAINRWATVTSSAARTNTNQLLCKASPPCYFFRGFASSPFFVFADLVAARGPSLIVMLTIRSPRAIPSTKRAPAASTVPNTV